MTIRTTRFVSQNLTGTAAVTGYTVPSGHRALIRGVSILNGRPAVSYCVVAVFGPGPTIRAGYTRSAPVGISIESDPWLVAEAGETISVQATNGGAGAVTIEVAGVLFAL